MYAIGLSNVAMTIRTDKFRFSQPFYISVQVFESPDKCHRLPSSFTGEDSGFSKCHDYESSSTTESSIKPHDSTKQIRITLKKLARGESYLKPTFAFLGIVLAVCVCGLLSMAGKDLTQFKNPDEESPLPSNGQPHSLQPIIEEKDQDERPVETANHNISPAEEQASNHNNASMEEEVQVDSDNGINGGEENVNTKEGIVSL